MTIYKYSVKWHIAFMVVVFLYFSAGCIGKTPEGLVRDLESSDREVRENAAVSLIGMGNRSVKPLLGILDSGSERAKFIAIQLLGSLGDSTALEPVREYIEYDHEHLRSAAAEALGKLGSKKSYPALRKACQDSMDIVRESAVAALGNFWDPANLDVLLSMIHDSSINVRKKAIEAVWRTRDPLALSGLLIAIRDSETEVRFVAAQALGNFDTWSAVQALMQRIEDRHEHPHVRMEAADALAMLKAKIAIPVMEQAYDRGTDLEKERIGIALRSLIGESYGKI